MSKQRYRSEIGTISDILSVITDSGRNGIIISAVSRMTNVSYKALNEKCQKLIDANLVKSVKDGRMCTFFITEKGAIFFEQLCKFTDMMKSMNIRY